MDTLKYSVYWMYGCIFMTNLPVSKAEENNVIIIALKQVQEGTTTHRIRDWQGASSIFFSCYWDLLGIQHRTAGTIQLRMAGLERNYYPGGKCDS